MLMDTIDRYLALRRACGYVLEGDERTLRSYARFAAQREELHVRQQSAVEWAAFGSSSLRREQRLRRVVIFARHAHIEDNAHEIPPVGVFSTQHTTRRIPYIFSEEELERLLIAALKLGPPEQLRPQTFYTLYGLLACTGLRISEALQLRLEDVTEDGLLIRESKNKNSRLIPLHATSSNVLKDYIEKRERAVANTNHLFVIEPKRWRKPICRPVSYETARLTFHLLVRTCDIKSKPGCPAPRLHDMRHRFSLKALENASTGRDHVSSHMLATRLGIRDRAMLQLAIASGLRVSELVGLKNTDITFRDAYIDIYVMGKGRRERIITLKDPVIEAIRAWLSVRGETTVPELFLNSNGHSLTRSGFTYILRKHTKTASVDHPSLLKKRVSPHVLRHTAAILILQATGDIRKVALVLGHASQQTTEKTYLGADPMKRLEIAEAILPPTLRPGVFSPPDKLLDMLKRSQSGAKTAA